MPVMSIVKKYNRRSPMNNIVITDKIPFKSKEDGYAWLKAMTKIRTDFDILDYSWALDVGKANSVEVLENPVNGKEGKIGDRDISE